MAVKIVTDSTANMPQELVQQLDITVVPAYVLMDDEAYREGEDISTERFYSYLLSSPRLPTTSQPTPTDFRDRVGPLVEEGHQVVCITVSRQLSGTYNSAIQAAAEFADGAVAVVDSATVAHGHMLHVLAAARDAANGATTADAVRQAAASRTGSGVTFCAFDTLEYAQRGGRVSKARAMVGSLLKVKPVLHVSDGELVPLERPRNMRRAIQRLAELVRGQGAASLLAIGYTTDPAPAEDLRGLLSGFVPADRTYMGQMGPAVGTHGGPGAIGVATLP